MILLRTGMLLIACGMALTAPTAAVGGVPPASTTSPHVPPSSPMSTIQRLFISGHSLTDPPLAPNLVLITQSLTGSTLQWNMQSMQGSSIRERTRGDRPEYAYRRGANRVGSDMNVLTEWQSPTTVQGGLYDTLLVTERHGVLSSLTWQQTLETLHGIHDDFMRANAQGRTWFYEAWLGLDDKNDPSRWIAYERAAAPVWRCVVARVNGRIAAQERGNTFQQGRSNTLRSVPAGIALASLVERAVQGKVAALAGGGPRQVVDRLISDHVHLTPWGSYYIASVVYATLWGRSPVGAVAPTDVPRDVALALQEEAWRFVDGHRTTVQTPTMQQCRDTLKQGFIRQHWSYVRDTQWAPEEGRLAAWRQWLQQWVGWQWRIRRQGADNPFAD